LRYFRALTAVNVGNEDISRGIRVKTRLWLNESHCDRPTGRNGLDLYEWELFAV